MSRQTFVFDHETGKVVPKGTETARQRGGLQIIRDFAEPLLNPADGQHYGTRPAYEAATRRAGAVEIGHSGMAYLRDRIAAQGGPGTGGPSVRETIRQALERTGG